VINDFLFLLVYNAETDEDEPTSTKKPFELANFFHGKHFYIFDNDFDDDTLHDIKRVIYAYDGILEKHLTSDVKYIITNRLWNQDFDKVYKRILEFNLFSLIFLDIENKYRD
jgi:hypothetical protein